MDQRKYERIKARLMQKKREAGDALKAIAHKPGNPQVSRKYGKAMDRYQKARRRWKGTMKTEPETLISQPGASHPEESPLKAKAILARLIIASVGGILISLSFYVING